MITANSKYKTGYRRLTAAIIDAIIFIPLAFADNFVWGNLDNKIGLIFWTTLMTVTSIFYAVIMHYKYGQTLGKMVVNVKVVTLDEKDNLTIKQALLRDSFYIFAEVIGLIFFVFEIISADLSITESLERFGDFGAAISTIWIILELISMLTNEKRRAIHDFIAGSVVIKTME